MVKVFARKIVPALGLVAIALAVLCSSRSPWGRASSLAPAGRPSWHGRCERDVRAEAERAAKQLGLSLERPSGPGRAVERNFEHRDGVTVTFQVVPARPGDEWPFDGPDADGWMSAHYIELGTVSSYRKVHRSAFLELYLVADVPAPEGFDELGRRMRDAAERCTALDR